MKYWKNIFLNFFINSQFKDGGFMISIDHFPGKCKSYLFGVLVQ